MNLKGEIEAYTICTEDKQHQQESMTINTSIKMGSLKRLNKSKIRNQ